MRFNRRAFFQVAGAGVATLAAAADPAAVLESSHTAHDADLTADPKNAFWSNAPHVTADRNYLGQPIPGAPTVIRSRWSDQNLYLLYTCPYEELNLKPNPNPAAETAQLWNWDVAEAFIGSDYEHIGRYKELQVSPQSEWVDLDIDRDNPKTQPGMKWNSGYTVKGRIDAPNKTLVRRDAHSLPRDRFPPAARGQGTAHRTVSHFGLRREEGVLCLASAHGDVLSRSAGVRHAAAARVRRSAAV